MMRCDNDVFDKLTNMLHEESIIIIYLFITKGLCLSKNYRMDRYSVT